ncbi:lactococcin 972 family bacteriocin [Austwickia chelonae]|uniref:lactococcin 972 family bacteriocin n=1 Tax=Austwickia chelonae TaxID=100225 RepID=UPI0013C3153F
MHAPSYFDIFRALRVWDYGHGWNSVWSNYWHPSNVHGSSVTKNGTRFDSGCTPAHQRSYASTMHHMVGHRRAILSFDRPRPPESLIAWAGVTVHQPRLPVRYKE